MRCPFGRFACLLPSLLGLAWLPAAAESYVTEELRIPMEAAGPHGLEALLIRLDGAERRPLMLLNHGSPRAPSERPTMSAYGLWPQAMEFARRGWTAVTVMRRGYGSSAGGFAEAMGRCDNPGYYRAGQTAANDLKAAIAFLANRPDIDAQRIVSIGVSAGGYASVALTADPPPGLVAAISFAGGRGSPSDGVVCREDIEIDAFAAYGRSSRLPTLWVYAENDHYFGPRVARRFVDAFAKAGGLVTYLPQPAFGEDGHKLFSAAGIARWTPLVDAFLAERGLQLRATPAAPPPPPDLRPPAGLGPPGYAAFQEFLSAAPHKAFAMGASGAWGWRSAQGNEERARSGALENCGRSGRGGCRILFFDDHPIEN